MQCARPAPVGIGLGLAAHRSAGRAVGVEAPGRHLVASRSTRLAWRPRAPTAVVCTADLAGVASTVPAIATSVAVVWGALMLTGDGAHGGEGRKACPACGGTGVESCFCNRWSDGDAGCNSCNHTGYMTCRRCGGGGTAVPIALAVRNDHSAGGPL